jgi:non-specific serine/threonine protein kinase
VYYCFQGQNDQAVTHLEEALSVARQQGCVLFESRILAVMGRALVGKGDFGRAESILMQGVLAAKRLKYYEIIALCFEYLGQAAWMKRKRESAGRLLGAAVALRTHVGVVYWFPDPNHPLIADELGPANPPGGPQLESLLPEQIVAWALETVEMPFGANVSSAGLTLRELEIAKLITLGLSNRQIAEQLYISRRTVDAHVQHILAKLDVNARAQVSAWYTARCSNA